MQKPVDGSSVASHVEWHEMSRPLTNGLVGLTEFAQHCEAYASTPRALRDKNQAFSEKLGGA